MAQTKKSKIDTVHVEESAKLKAIFMDRNKLSQEAFGAAHGIGSQGMVWQYLNAGSPLNLEAALKFASALQCSVSDFSPRLAKALALGGASLPSPLGLSEAEQKAPGPTLLDLTTHPDLVAVPRVKFKLSAGVSGFAIEPENGNGKPVFFRKDWFKSKGYKPAKLFSVRVCGASMEPALWDSDLVVINTDDTAPKDGEAFAMNYEGELVIKRLRRDAGEWWATSDNADQRRFAPKRCTADVKVIGRVVYKQSERI